MLPFVWLVLLLCGVGVLFSFPGILFVELRRAYSGPRRVTCPATREPSLVQLDARKAASTLIGPRVVSIASCSRWPAASGCAEDCVPEALTLAPPDAFAVHHLGVFVAAMVSWAASGALRYSPIARDWMSAAGMAPATFWSRIGQRAPVIASFFGMLAVAYVFTWLMRHTEQSGLAHSYATAGLMWLAIMGITLPETVFFVPARVYAFDGLAMLIALLIQATLLGLLVVPKTAEKKSTADIQG